MEHDGKCSFVVPRKNRRCRMNTKPGRLFCGEHGDKEPGTKRIPCPLNPAHTVDTNQLAKHLTVCHARVPEAAWVEEDVNVVKDHAEPGSSGQVLPSDSLLRRVEAAFSSLEPIPLQLVEVLSHASVVVDEAVDGKDRIKHLSQETSILAHMDKEGLLSQETPCCFVELGAGKARLSSHLARLLPPEKASFLLVDRSGMRNKHDNKARRDLPDLRLSRLRCDIRHLRLAKVEAARADGGCVYLWKHLCGNATDIGIRLMLNAEEDGVPTRGLALVPCCHHKMEPGDYCGWEWLEAQGFRRDDFAALRTLCSWAVCGRKRGELDETPESKAQESVGRKARALLQHGRLAFLRAKCPQLELRLVDFVGMERTPENSLLLGWLK